MPTFPARVRSNVVTRRTFTSRNDSHMHTGTTQVDVTYSFRVPSPEIPQTPGTPKTPDTRTARRRSRERPKRGHARLSREKFAANLLTATTDRVDWPAKCTVTSPPRSTLPIRATERDGRWAAPRVGERRRLGTRDRGGRLSVRIAQCIRWTRCFCGVGEVARRNLASKPSWPLGGETGAGGVVGRGATPQIGAVRCLSGFIGLGVFSPVGVPLSHGGYPAGNFGLAT